MKTLLILQFFFLAHMVLAQVTQTIKILPESKIYLYGVSNVNEFSCELCNNEKPETLNLCYSKEQDQLVFDDNRYAISVEKFECENRHMTRDLKETLKVDEHPYIFLELERLEGLIRSQKSNQATLIITIAGKSNEYCLPYTLEQVGQRTYKIELENEFNMRDFDIKPPTALMGLIKVKEQISIKLDLLIELSQTHSG